RGCRSEGWLEERDFFTTRIHPEDRMRVMTAFRAALARGHDHEFEYRALRASGDVVSLRDIVHVVPGTAARPGQLRGLTVDLTELKHADEALRHTQHQLR